MLTVRCFKISVFLDGSGAYRAQPEHWPRDMARSSKQSTGTCSFKSACKHCSVRVHATSEENKGPFNQFVTCEKYRYSFSQMHISIRLTDGHERFEYRSLSF